MQYFLALAEQLHFGQTAACLGISQPALSKQVHRLEAEFGIALLERTSRTTALTTAGRAILDPLGKCLAAYDEARQAAREAGQGQTRRLRIGFPGSEVGWIFLPAVLRKISEHLPDTRIEVVEASCERQAADLKERRIDAGFIHLPVTDAGLGALRIRNDELVVLLPRNHPSVAAERVPIGCLAEEPFIDFRLRCPAYGQAVSSLMRKSGLSPRTEYGSTGLSTTVEMVASRLGVAIVPGLAVQQLHQGIVARPLLPVGKALDIAFVWQIVNPSAELRQLQSLIRQIGTESTAARLPAPPRTCLTRGPGWHRDRIPATA